MLKDKIKEIASEHGKTLREVSEESGVPYAAIMEWNASVPNAIALAKVCQVIGTTTEELLKGEI